MTLHDREQMQRLLDRAIRAHDMGDLSQAMALVDRALGLMPGDQAARLLYAELLLDAARPDEALKALNAAQWYASENTMFIEEGGAQAEEASEGQAGAHHARRMLLLAETYTRLSRKDDARRVLIQLITDEPDHPLGLRRLAALQIESGKHEEAVQHLRRLLSIYPEDRHALGMLAESYEALNEPEQALGAYQQLAAESARIEAQARAGASEKVERSLMQDSGVLNLRVARLKRRARRFCEAFESFDRLLAEDEDPVLATEAARLAAEMGNDKQARRYLCRALSESPGAAEPLRQLALQHMRCGRFAAAGRVWFGLWRKNLNDGHAAAGLAVCSLCEERFDLGDRMLRHLTARHDRAHRRVMLAGMWLVAVPGRLLRDGFRRPGQAPTNEVLPVLLQQAQQVIERQIQLHPEYADLRYHDALCNAELGRSDAAVASAREALRLNGRYLAAARLHVELLLRESSLQAAERLLDAMAVNAGQASSWDATSMLDLEIALRSIQGRIGEALALVSDPKGAEFAARSRIVESALRLLARTGHAHSAAAVRRQWLKSGGDELTSGSGRPDRGTQKHDAGVSGGLKP